MDGPCDICGDVGVLDVIVTCSQCKIAREHIYCMRKNLEEFPEIWLCVACVDTGVDSSNARSRDAAPRTAAHNFSTKVQPASRVTAGYPKFCRGARSNWHEKGVGKGKTKYLWTQEVIKLPSGDKKGDLHPRFCQLTSSPSKPMTSTSRIAQTKPKRMASVNALVKVKGNPSFVPSRLLGHLSPPRPEKTQSNIKIQKLKEKIANMHTTKNLAQKRLSKPFKDTENTNSTLQRKVGKTSCSSSLSPRCQPPVISGGDYIKSTEPKKNFSESTTNSDPAPNVCWKGSFKLKDQETSDGFWAQHPSKVHRKVNEFSKKMPEVLEFEILPCQDLLMDLFQGDPPEKNDVGLYFFPSNSERSKRYISLLEHLAVEELAIRSLVDGVELIVFTSKVLHEDSCEWSENGFLWGICRSKQNVARCKLPFDDLREDNMVIDMDIDIDDADSTILESVDEVDMDIDMVGGHIVGTVDVVLPRKSTDCNRGTSGAETTAFLLPAVPREISPVLVKKEKCSDIPPGFGISSREMCSEIPPGFVISSGQTCSSIKSEMFSEIPPGFALCVKSEKAGH